MDKGMYNHFGESFSVERLLIEELKELKKLNLYRERLVPEGLKVLCSNNYLNLSQHPEVKRAAVEAVERFGTGSGASQLVSGYTYLHRKVEKTLQKVKKIPSCLTVGSGYLANLAVVSALVGPNDVVISDRLNHASIIDGVRLSRASRFVYSHRKVEEVKEFLQKERSKYRKCLIITDGVFSMDGDLAPLPALVELAEKFDCLLAIDDAHATGTVGFSSLDRWSLRWKPFVVEVGTFSKALGSYGSYICGSKTVIEYLVNRARPVIFSTSMPPAAVAAAERALRLLLEEPSLISRLRERSKRIKSLLRKEGLDLGLTEEDTPIVPLMVYDERKALLLRNKLLEKGFFVQAIRYPTVERKKARLRLTITLEHPVEVYLEFVSALKEAFEEVSL